tara:strand:- start:2416 stop:3057 length:642 start_codon:yes stop_codon:yes gene_type:complete
MGATLDGPDMLTVTTAAPDRSLLTATELRAAIGVADASQDAALATIGARVSATIARLCRVAEAAPSPVTLRSEVLTEVFRLNVGTEELILARRPVASITSVVADDVTLETTEYETEAGPGLLFYLCDDYRTMWTAAKITVVYTAGWDTVPEDLKLAAAKLVGDIYHAGTRDPNLRRHRVEGVGEREYWVSPASDPLASQEVMQLLAPYTNWTI